MITGTISNGPMERGLRVSKELSSEIINKCRYGLIKEVLMDWKNLKNKAEVFSRESLATLTILSSDVTTQISKATWFKDLNDFSSEVSKAMDHNFIKEKITEVMTPTNHRILDGGHDFFSSISKAREIGEQNDWSTVKVFEEWSKAYFTDMSSPAGVPLFGKFSDDMYKYLKELGISDHEAADVVTINGQEALETLMSGAISAVAIVFAWKAQDKEAFSKSIGFILISGVATMTPAALIVAIVALAFGYNTLVCKESITKGVLSSGLTMAVSALLPGPVLLGLIPAVILTIYVNKKLGKDFRPLEQSAKLFELVRSEEFKKDCIFLYEEMRGKVTSNSEKEAA